MSEEKETLTITLTDRQPVKIIKDEWPIVARAHEHDGRVECQANRHWKLIVRQHDDGRVIVYGIYDTNHPNEKIRRGGVLVPSKGTAKSEIAAAIKRVAEALRFEDRLAQVCIADLPAEELF